MAFEKCQNCRFYQQVTNKDKLYFYNFRDYELNKKILFIIDSPLTVKQIKTIKRAFLTLWNLDNIGFYHLTNCASHRPLRQKNSLEIKQCMQEVDLEKLKDNKILLVCGAQTKKALGISQATPNFSQFTYGNSKIIILSLLTYFFQDFYNNMKQVLKIINSPVQEPDIKIIYYSDNHFKRFFDNAEYITLDIETEGTLNPYKPFKITHISLTSPEAFPYVMLLKTPKEIKNVKRLLKTKKIVGFNTLFDLVHLYRYFNIPVKDILKSDYEDVMFMYYCFNEEVKINIGSASLKAIALNELNVPQYSDPFQDYLKTLKEYKKTKEKWDEKYSNLLILTKNAMKTKEKLLQLESNLKQLQLQVDIYSALDSYYTHLLYNKFKTDIYKNYKSLYSFLKTSAKHLTVVIDNGMQIDIDAVKKLKTEYKKQMLNSQRLIRTYTHKDDLNLSSEHQLTEALKPYIKNPVKTKTGLISFTEGNIKEYKKENKKYAWLFNALLNYKYAEKMLGTYIKTFEDMLSEDNLFHGGFNICGTETGRISSKFLLHQLPNTEIRRIFTSRFGENGIFISADYKQMELRMSAMLSNDKQMINDLQRDIYKEFIAQVLNKPVNKITDEERNIGKKAVLATLYGITKYGLSKLLEIPIEEAEKYINTFYSRYQTYARWKENIINKIQNEFEIIYSVGRHRRFPQFITPHFVNRRLKHRLFNSGVNAPVQGTASDITIINLIRLQQAFIRNNLKSKIINVVHDSFLIDCYKPEFDTVINLIKKYALFIPDKWINSDKKIIAIEIKTGKNYYDLSEKFIFTTTNNYSVNNL